MAEERNDDMFDEEDDDTIVLVDEEGNETEFEHIATLDYDNEWYILLQPVVLDEDMDEDEVIVFKIGTDSEGNDLFVPVDDEKVLDGVFKVYMEEVEACGDDCDCCDDDCDCDCCDDDTMFELECPACGKTIYLDESIFDSDAPIVCPACGAELEDLTIEEEDDDE